MHTAYIGIGSNLGDRQKNCLEAARLVGENSKIRVMAVSKWRETPPLAEIPRLNPKSQFQIPVPKPKSQFQSPNSSSKSQIPVPNSKVQIPMYINGAMKIETSFTPSELLGFLQGVEKRLGRARTGVKWEDRTIDLDILFYDDLLINTPTLKIPHPELHKRMFVLEPLCDIEPGLIHPLMGVSVEQLKEKL